MPALFARIRQSIGSAASESGHAAAIDEFKAGASRSPKTGAATGNTRRKQ
jgi:hypothetical protein